MEELEGRARVIIAGVKPEIDNGRFSAKRIIGETVVVEADIYCDGHDVLSAILLFRSEADTAWSETPMKLVVNDRWAGSFLVTKTGYYCYTVSAWADRFKSWYSDFAKRVEAGQEDLKINLLVGLKLISEAGERADDSDRQTITQWVKTLEAKKTKQEEQIKLILSDELASLINKYSDRRFAVTYSKELTIQVDREKARFSTWYEMFPRSCGTKPGLHGNFKDCEARLPYIANMGFDVLYLPPIHPIGHTNRKGKNNTLIVTKNDPGTPWAIGSEEGGHKDVHPQLGTLNDFRSLVSKAKKNGIEIALDIAFQCSPDHLWVKEHPEWFRWRPDNTIQYAENPPKKYQDIYPLNFESENWLELWEELKSVIIFWIKQGINIFRIDNPHTKPFRFWEWLIGEVKKLYPDVLFLSEAFTRPKVMSHLGKLGFTQSYTYFAWRNTKWEITQYCTELTQTEISDYLRPNFWPNTPDILTEYLQVGGRASFIIRLVLAATLSSSYGIYGPAFELCENQPKEPGTEEYLDSEKYEIKYWDINRNDSLKDFIARVNRIRVENPALQSNANLHFYPIENERLICYGKHTDDLSNIILVIVNLDPYHIHNGWIELPLEELGLDAEQPFQVHDLLSGARYLWHGLRNYVELNPQIVPAHILRIRRRTRTERDFDYYL